MLIALESDLRAFAERVDPWLAQEPFRYNVLRTLIAGQLRSGIDPDALWVRVHSDDGDLIAVAVQTPPRALLLSSMTPQVAEALADDLAGRVPSLLPGVDGLGPEVDAFAHRYAHRIGVTLAPGMTTTLYRLGELIAPAGVAGALREATGDDRPLVLEWVSAFSAEAVPDESPGEPAPQVDSRLAYGGLLWLWEVDGEPVSFLWLSAPAAGVVRISAVYTPPDQRGKGYAGACVAAAAARSYERGATGVMLYADRTNPTSNALYRRLGFEGIAEGRSVLFSRR